MSYQLLILRHAKSSWSNPTLGDFDRPLNERGRQDALRMGRFLSQHGLVPDLILSSSAKRALQTTHLVCQSLALEPERVQWLREVYMAEQGELAVILRTSPEHAKRVMLVGHNPGLENLAEHLSKTSLPRTAKGKLITTACLVHLELTGPWVGLDRRCADLLGVYRPKHLP